MSNEYPPVAVNMQAPIIETQPGTLDMSAMEANFNAPLPEAQADITNAHVTAAEGGEDDFQQVVGFDPTLMAAFLRVTPGSEAAKNIERAMFADFVINNAVAYNLIPSTYEETMDRKRRIEDNEDEEEEVGAAV